MKKLIATAALGLAGLAGGSTAVAEPGDYSSFQTFLNLLFPPGPDRPVSPAERSGEFGLKSNPGSFEDGFSGGRYLQWQTVKLHPSTGAVCGNGSPYKFFVNRVASTRNMMFYFEGGGACWDYESCTGATGIRGARNPDGIPDDYLSSGDPATGLVSPFVWRTHPYSRVKTQDWTLIYVPYCTGDVYSGNSTEIYTNPSDPNDNLVWHHNGLKNVRAVTSWVRDNLQRPTQMLATGCSAGGAGSLTNYHPLRRDMDASFNFLINDSGPLFPTDQNGDIADNPSQPLHLRLKDRWGVDSILTYFSSDLPGINTDDYGSISDALGWRYPNDRMGHTHFQLDQNYSSYSYERFFPEIESETNPDVKAELLTEKWLVDSAKLFFQLQQYPQYGGYFPLFRDVNESHCTTVIDFENGDIQELGLELEDFIGSVLDGSGPVLTAVEQDTQADFNKPFNLLYSLIGILL